MFCSVLFACYALLYYSKSTLNFDCNYYFSYWLFSPIIVSFKQKKKRKKEKILCCFSIYSRSFSPCIQITSVTADTIYWFKKKLSRICFTYFAVDFVASLAVFANKKVCLTRIYALLIRKLLYLLLFIVFWISYRRKKNNLFFSLFQSILLDIFNLSNIWVFVSFFCSLKILQLFFELFFCDQHFKCL